MDCFTQFYAHIDTNFERRSGELRAALLMVVAVNFVNTIMLKKFLWPKTVSLAMDIEKLLHFKSSYADDSIYGGGGLFS